MAVVVAGEARPAPRARALGASAPLWLALLALTGLRLVLAGAIPLTEDEAYYRLWAQHPAFGYFDHPPMAAWWIAAGRTLLGDTPLGARVVAAFATLATSLMLVDLVRVVGGSQRAAERAGLWYNAALLIALGGAVTTPDAPATLFWTACLLALARALAGGGLALWAAAGLAAGLGCLSKYSALFIGPGVLLYLLWDPAGRRALATPGPWLALLVAGAVFSPNLLWNASHHWLSFAKQFSRVAPTGFTPRHVIDFPLTQVLLLNPLIALFAARGLTLLPWRVPETRRLGLLVLAPAPFAAYLVLHSFHDGVQAHWPAPLYPALAALAALTAEALAGRPFWDRLARAVPALGFALSAAVFAHLLLPATDLGRKDPVLPLRGWTPFAEAVEAARVRAGAGWTGTFSYGTAAELLAQNRSAAPILELIERPRYLFAGPAAEPLGPGLVVELARRLEPADFQDCFARFEELAPIRRGDPGGPSVSYRVFRVEAPRRALAAEGCREGKDRIRPAASGGSAGGRRPRP